MNSPERSALTLPEGLANASILCNNAAAEALAPDPELYVSDWADQHRRLSSKTSAEVGQWQTSRTPYLREFMNALSLSHPATDCYLKKGTQIGGSEGLYNAMGATIDQSPCPMMLVMPTVDTAKRISRQRLQPMIDETPALTDKIGERKSRDSSNTVLMKDFPGGYLVITGANSGPGLRSTPVRVLLMDEVDAYPDDVDGEGDPCAVAEKRTDTFSRAKRCSCSSPKIKGKSRIDRLYHRGTRARYYVPCPHCGHLQYLQWQQIRWEMEKRRELLCSDCGTVTEYHGEAPAACPHCDQPAKPDALRETATDDVAEAWYECESCTARIDEHYKTAMMEEWPAGHAHYIHEMPGIGEVLADDDPHPHAIWALIAGKARRFLPRFRRPLSWQVSALYSPLGWFSWRKAVVQFLEAKKGGYVEESGESLLQVFYNTVLGEAYEVPGTRPDEQILKLRAEAYDLGQVPAGALLLTAAVDLQGDRFEVKVKGYGRGVESWLVDYQVIMYAFGAKKPTPEDWEKVLAIRNKGYPHAGGQTVRITAMAIDCGYLTQEVYDFCRKWGHRHIFATKGMPERGKPIMGRPTLQDVHYEGKLLKAGVRMWPIGTDTAKEQVYARLDLVEPGPGYMHLPRGLPDSYFDGLTSEKLIRKQVRGSIVNEWVKVVERNEPLDLEILCYAAAIYAGVQRTNWDQLEQVINPGQLDIFIAAGRAEAAKHAGTDAAAVTTVQTSAPDGGADAAPRALPPAPPLQPRRRLRHAGINH